MGNLAATAALSLVIVLCARALYVKWNNFTLTACQLDPHPWGQEKTAERPPHPAVYRAGMAIMYAAFAVMLGGVAAALFDRLAGGGIIHAGSWLGLLGYGLTEWAGK